MITIIDSIMGSGKTCFMIDYINDAHHRALGQSFDGGPEETLRFLYVAPLLSEVDRINEACPGLQFRDPQPVGGKKLNHLSDLVDQGANICTTHALFRMITKNICQKLREQNYVLVLDEVLDCVGLFEDLSRSDRELLVKDGLVYVEPDTNRLRWNNRDHKDYSGRFNSLRNLCDNGNLVMFRNTVMWEFPTEFLECFDQVFILTYLFQGSPMSAYLRASGLEHETKTLQSGELVPVAANADESVVKSGLRDLVSVYEGRLNRAGDRTEQSNPFSVTWLKAQPEKELKAIKASTEHWFKEVAKTPATHNAWTTYKEAKRHLKGARYTKGWIPCNAKATNDYIEKRSLAYLCNVFYHPLIKGYFEARGIVVYEDLYALSEMIQWVWRSQIRRGDPISVFIPSERMRTLFKRWLADDSVLLALEHRQAA